MIWQPTLRSASLLLRPLLDSDHAALFAAAADPEIWRQHPSSDRHRPEVFDQYFAGALASQGALLISDAATQEVLGSSRYVNHHPETRSVEIGYTFLIRSRWGGTCNAQVKRLMLEHAFTQVDTVWFVVGEHNLRSRRAMEKIGGTLTPHHAVPHVDGRTDHVFYRVQRS